MLSERNSTTLTRQALYEKVWTTRARTLAKEFGISDVALGKVCRKHKIPKPPPGYWTAKRFGKAVTPIPLSNIDDQELDTVTIVDRNQREVIPESDSIRAMSAAEKSSKPIVVPKRIGHLHPLVARSKAAMTKASADYRGIVSPHEKDCLGISVGIKNVSRAIRIMNALIHALEARGYAVSAGLDDRKAVTIVKILDEQVKFRLDEAQTRKKRVRKPGDTYFLRDMIMCHRGG